MSKRLYFIAALSFLFLRHSIIAEAYSSACSPSSGCGNGVPIKYPFWVNNDSAQEYSCGYPDFGLKCSDYGQPILSLTSDSYYVTDIDYEYDTVTLVDMDVVNKTCPRARHNVSLGDFPLRFNHQLNLNLGFYFNCSASNDVVNVTVNRIGCLKNEGSKQSYVFEATYDWNIECEEKVVAVVKKEEIRSNNLATGFGEAMNKGFVLDWQRSIDCAACEDSGGFCGHNQIKHQMLCICRDGGSIATKSCSNNDVPFVSIHRRSLNLPFILGVSGAIGLLLLCITVYCCKSKSWRRITRLSKTSEVDQNIEAFIRNHGPLALTRYKFADVKKMTNSFKHQLGQGGYGSVYKGQLLNGCPVAVKLLKASNENGEDFINEVASISRTSHVNVVTLLGFCFEGKKKALIYEFMSNGSLDKFIHNNADKNTLYLTWENLYNIAIGIARGLEYLHKGCNTRILHFDIKPHNILLDEDFCPKISDFGLAKLCPKNESVISISEARGTIGYLAPEVWNRNIGGVSHKSDVYSYGMMLLDMVGGRKNMNVETNCSTDDKYFPDYIYAQLEQASSLGCNGANNMEGNDMAKRMTIVGLWCIQIFPSQRPTISRVIEMLDTRLDSLEMPPKPLMPSPQRLELESATTSNTITQNLGSQSSSYMLQEDH